MFERILTNKYFWVIALLCFALYLYMRPQIQAAMTARRTGKQATLDAASLNGYTTYNTSLYQPPAWFPWLKFFKANPYVPTPQAAAPTQTYSQPQNS